MMKDQRNGHFIFWDKTNGGHRYYYDQQKMLMTFLSQQNIKIFIRFWPKTRYAINGGSTASQYLRVLHRQTAV